MLQILTGDGWVITNHEEPIAFLEEHRERIQDQREVGLLSSVEFLADVLGWHVDAFVHAAEQLEHDVDELDDAALRQLIATCSDGWWRCGDASPACAACSSRTAACMPISHVLTSSFTSMSARCRPCQPSFSGWSERWTASGTLGRCCIGTFDVHMTRTAQRTNDVMKVLTLASVILLPSVVLAGVMGMNFKVPLFDNPDMFWVVVGLMATLAVGTVVVAKWLKWL